MVLNGTPDHGHAETGSAAAHFFLRIKGFKNKFEVLIRYTGSVVGHRQYGVFSIRNDVVSLLKGVHILIGCRDDDLTLVGDRFRGIVHQVHHRFGKVQG